MADAPIAKMLGLKSFDPRQVRKAIAALVGANRDARELFLGEDGEMKPAAVRLFATLGRESGLTDLGEFQPDARLQDHMHGRQYIVRRLAAMIDLDVPRLEMLQRKLGDER